MIQNLASLIPDAQKWQNAWDHWVWTIVSLRSFTGLRLCVMLPSPQQSPWSFPVWHGPFPSTSLPLAAVFATSTRPCAGSAVVSPLCEQGESLIEISFMHSCIMRCESNFRRSVVFQRKLLSLLVIFIFAFLSPKACKVGPASLCKCNKNIQKISPETKHKLLGCIRMDSCAQTHFSLKCRNWDKHLLCNKFSFLKKGIKGVLWRISEYRLNQEPGMVLGEETSTGFGK